VDGGAQGQIPARLGQRLLGQRDRLLDVGEDVGKPVEHPGAGWAGGQAAGQRLEDRPAAGPIARRLVVVGGGQLPPHPVGPPAGWGQPAGLLGQLRGDLRRATARGGPGSRLERGRDMLVRLLGRQGQVERPLLKVVEDGGEASVDLSALRRGGVGVGQRAQQRVGEADPVAVAHQDPGGQRLLEALAEPVQQPDGGLGQRRGGQHQRLAAVG
jgi:hypothetical protein